MEVLGEKNREPSLQVAHHNLTWHLHFPNNIGIVWEVGRNGEARVFSIADVAGHNSNTLLTDGTLLQLLNTVLAPIFQNFTPSDTETTLF